MTIISSITSRYQDLLCLKNRVILKRKLNKAKGLVAHMRRGGSSIDGLVIDVAHDLQNGGDGNYIYHEDGFKTNRHIYHPLDERSVSTSIKSDHFFTTHLPVSDYFLFDGLRTIVKLRSPLKQIPSYIIHLKRWTDTPNGLELDTAIDYYIKFCNFWLRQNTNTNNIVLLYEDFMKDQVSYYSQYCEHLNLEIGIEPIKKAVELCSYEKTQQKIPSQNKNSARRSYAQKVSKELSQEDYVRLRSRLRAELRVELPNIYLETL